MRITPAMLQTWFDCPKRYWWMYVEGVRKPPLLASMWEASVFSALVMCMKQKADLDTLPSLEQMVKHVMDRYQEGLDTLEKQPRKGKMDAYFAHATTVCQEFLMRDMMVMTPKDAGILMHKDLGSGHQLMAPVHVIDGKQLGMLDVCQYPTTKKNIEASPALVCATMVSGIDHYWHLSISVKKGASFKKLHGYMPEGRQRWYERIINEVVPAMENGPYPPCNPGVYHCARKGCQYFYECRGTADVKGRVTRV